ncbi:MAG: RHS repeat-associated core domain-containing protein, partial [Kiritimatiellae bacterium]|nr:RHS repeat-associated core domain-containing protein [Kiritimatiellia bacterium]
TFYGSRTFNWSGENQLSQINDSYLGQVDFEYGAGGGLVSQISTPAGAPSTTTQYIGDGLAEYSTAGSGSGWNDYIAAPSGTLAMVVQSSSQADVAEYLQKDNQGSVLAVTDGTGNLVQQYAYDPYGRRSVTYTAANYGGIQTDLGFTGHRQIDFLNLVHMRGRVYDTSMARFLSADPNIQSPGNAQSLNRYAYVWNNPLTFTDPSGYFLSGFSHWFGHNWQPFAGIAIIVVAPELGPEVGLSSAATTALVGGFAAGLVSSGGSLQAGFAGADFGLLNFAIGDAFGEVSASGAFGNQSGVYVQKIVAHGIVGGMQGSYLGRNFGSGFLAGAAQSAASPFIVGPAPLKISEAAIVGGTASVIGGGKFENGALTGAFAEAFNECAHGACDYKWEQRLYDYFPGYKGGTCVSNLLGGGECGWLEAFDLGSSVFGVAGKGLALLSDGASAARGGLSSLGGIFSSETNAVGGEVWTSVGEISQNDFASIVNSGLYKGDVNIISGVHGFWRGTTTVDSSLFEADVTRFGKIPGVYIYDFSKMTPTQIRGLLNGPGTTIGGFCDSGACLAPFK